MDKFQDLFANIPQIDSICCVLGLKFPDSATEFQKAALTLAHVMASIRDFVLKGYDVPVYLLDLIDNLHYVMHSNAENQK